MLKVEDKVYRNLPEQVGYLSTKVKEILEYLDGINVADNVVIVYSLSQILDEEELEVVKKPVSFIVYNDALYLKQRQDATTAYFVRALSMELSTIITLSSDTIQVDIENGSLGIVSSSVVVYSKTQIDTELAKKADLTGAAFTGAITAPSIIEDMVGYSYTPATVTKGTLANVYMGAVKNGNKVTFVAAYTFIKNVSETGQLNIGKFNIPSSIGSKIYPAPDASSTVDVKKGIAISTATYANFVDIELFVTKYTNAELNLGIRQVDNLVAGTKYYIRHEITFLLSDNLAS